MNGACRFRCITSSSTISSVNVSGETRTRLAKHLFAIVSPSADLDNLSTLNIAGAQIDLDLDVILDEPNLEVSALEAGRQLPEAVKLLNHIFEIICILDIMNFNLITDNRDDETNVKKNTHEIDSRTKNT